MEYTDKDYNIIDKKIYDVWSNKHMMVTIIKLSMFKIIIRLMECKPSQWPLSIIRRLIITM